MVRKSYGKMRGTRKKLAKKRTLTVNAYLKTFKEGDRVHIDLVSSSPLPHPRFHGLTGEVIERRGRAYGVRIRDGHATKVIFLRSEHLKLQK